MAYTWKQLKDEVKSRIWPNGVPENLVGAIDRLFIDGVIHLQRYIPCYQQHNTDIYPQCATFFKCGMSVFPAPKGVIKKVYAVLSDGYCDHVTYIQTTPGRLYGWSRDFQEIVTAPTNANLRELPFGFKYPEQSTDSEYGRSQLGLWAADKGKVIVSPWLQSGETIIVEYDGLKRDWDDGDLAPEGNDVWTYLKLFVQEKYFADFEPDPVRQQQYRAEWNTAFGDLAYQCREETRLRPTDYQPEELDSLYRNHVLLSTTESTETSTQTGDVFAFISDHGTPGTALNNVAALVKSWNPEVIISGGGNDNGANTASTIDAVNGKFRNYIYPYYGSTALGSGEVDATENLFWPAFGGYDLNVSSGNNQKAYFSIPVFYYNFVQDFNGVKVHFFCLSSGLNTSGTLIEPAGNDSLSTQAEWFKYNILRSTADWKVVYFHHPPYTSETAFTTGTADMRWDFGGLGADIVLNGRARCYEHLNDGSIDYLVAGTGGATLSTFGTPVSQSQFRYADDHGAIKATVAESTLKFDFINTSETTIHTLTLTK